MQAENLAAQLLAIQEAEEPVLAAELGTALCSTFASAYVAFKELLATQPLNPLEFNVLVLKSPVARIHVRNSHILAPPLPPTFLFDAANKVRPKGFHVALDGPGPNTPLVDVDEETQLPVQWIVTFAVDIKTVKREAEMARISAQMDSPVEEEEEE